MEALEENRIGVHLEVRGQLQLPLSIALHLLVFYLFFDNLSMKLEFIVFTWTNWQGLWYLPVCILSAGATATCCHIYTWLLHWCWAANLGPYVCTASTLTTELSV